MSGVLGAFTSAECVSLDPRALDRMLDALSARGVELTATWRGIGAALGVTRNSWELHHDFSGDALVVRDGGLAIVADASLYYRDDLCAKLGVPSRATSTPSHLILAAYRAWGERCVDHLEGDYAFMLKFSPPAGATAPANPDDAPDFFTALQEQLGLKLQSEKGTVPYFIIDHIERPTPN